MKILQVLGNLGYGGIESFIMNIYRHIDRDKIQFDFLIRSTDNSEKIQEIESMGGNVILSPSFPQKPVSNYFFVKRFFDEHADEYDAIHVHCNSLVYPLPVALAMKHGIKTVILHSHNTCNHGKFVSLYHRHNEDKYDKYLDFRFACGEEAGKWMFGDKLFTVIHNGIDLNVFKIDNQKRIEYRNKLGFNDTDTVIGHVGGFRYQKNQEFLIDLLSELIKKSKDYKLILIGEGENKSFVTEKAEGLGILDNIVFTGNVNNVQDYMQAMDVFILPSRFEGLPVVAIEAQACGLPVLLSDKISVETGMNSNVEFLPLENLQSWLDYFEKNSTFTKCADQKNIRESGYDIKDSADKLVSYYICKNRDG